MFSYWGNVVCLSHIHLQLVHQFHLQILCGIYIMDTYSYIMPSNEMQFPHPLSFGTLLKPFLDMLKINSGAMCYAISTLKLLLYHSLQKWLGVQQGGNTPFFLTNLLFQESLLGFLKKFLLNERYF